MSLDFSSPDTSEFSPSPLSRLRQAIEKLQPPPPPYTVETDAHGNVTSINVTTDTTIQNIVTSMQLHAQLDGRNIASCATHLGQQLNLETGSLDFLAAPVPTGTRFTDTATTCPAPYYQNVPETGAAVTTQPSATATHIEASPTILSEPPLDPAMALAILGAGIITYLRLRSHRRK